MIMILLFIQCGLIEVKAVASEKTISNRIATCYDYLSDNDVKKGNKILEIKGVVDLKGQTFHVPESCILSFNGGIIRNGVVVGAQTKIDARQKSPFFESVRIEGSWNVPMISSTFFKDQSKENILLQLFALTDSVLYNKVVIERGTYYVSRQNERDGIINIKSNTDVDIKGRIILLPNNNTHCYLLNVENAENVTINGGVLVGDRQNHMCAKGEWGHGLFIWGNSKNVIVNNIKISECWGDGVAIGRQEPCKNISLNNLKIENCRRNGISIIAVEGCKVYNCGISNISGTAPEYAVDIEPNKGGHVKDVILEKLNIRSKSGILLPIINQSELHFIRDITIENCTIKTRLRCISVDGAENVKILGNVMENSNEESTPLVIDHDSRRVIISKNIIKKIIKEANNKVAVVFVNPDSVNMLGNTIIGQNCSAAYFVNGNHAIKENHIRCNWGFTRITNSLIENNEYYGDGFLVNRASNCIFKRNRIKSSTGLFVSDRKDRFCNNILNNNTIETKELQKGISNQWAGNKVTTL